MFLQKVIEKDSELINTVFAYHQRGLILPDTYVVDMDSLLSNARIIKNRADQEHIDLYFMLKQLGRNPEIAKRLIEIGYKGAVVVDWKEAQVMMAHQIPIANVGHLVQPPTAMVQQLVDYGCEYFTVYSLEKIEQINQAAKKSGKIQKILLRVTDDADMIYSGQTAGFSLAEIPSLNDKVKQLKNVIIAGVTSFPCFLYSEDTKDIEATNNLNTLLEAKKILESLGYQDLNINTPSTTCSRTLKKMAESGSTSGEPGHGLTGTTPLHASTDCAEIPCVVYLSEVSHNFEKHAYIFGGGNYRRGHIQNALVMPFINDSQYAKVESPNLDSIDYHFGLDREFPVGSTVIMAFRFQIFVTRSDVCLIEGIHQGNPHIIGLYSSLGEAKK